MCVDIAVRRKHVQIYETMHFYARGTYVIANRFAHPHVAVCVAVVVEVYVEVDAEVDASVDAAVRVTVRVYVYSCACNFV